jgi:hypothetical protein
MDEEINPLAARAIVQDWMLEHGKSASDLAAAAGLDRTVVHRFLRHARSMNLRTALRIYAALYAEMHPTTRHELLVALGLEDIARLFHGVDNMVQQHLPLGHAGTISDLSRAVALSERGEHVTAAEIFHRVEQAPTISRSMALFAACERARSLLAVGCVNAVRTEIERIDARFSQICGVDDMLNVQALHLRFAYELGDLDETDRLVRKLAFDAELHHNPSRISEAVYYGALLHMAYAMRATNERKRRQDLDKAARLFRMHDSYEHRHDADDVTSGLRALRWAEIHRARRAEDDAQKARHAAHRMLRHTPAAYHVCIELAKVALDRVQLERSRRIAAEAREIAAAADSGLGVAHASCVLAIADIMEERYEAALDHAVVGAALAPSWCYEDGTSSLVLMHQALRSLTIGQSTAWKLRFEHALHDRIAQRRGPYAVLASSLSANQDRRSLHVLGSVVV